MHESDDKPCSGNHRHDCPDCEKPLRACDECGRPYCSLCQHHVITETGMVAESPSASDIARTIGTLSNPAGETGLQFGKIFEEEYQEYWYRRERGGFGGYGSMKHAYFPKRVFSRRIAYRFREEGIYSGERVAHAVRLFSAFLAADIGGLTPPTRHRWHDDIVVYAKPDLRRVGSVPDLIEFKTGPIDEYARVQATVMAWVFDAPIRLAGAETDDTGWVDVQTERIEPSSAPIERYLRSSDETE